MARYLVRDVGIAPLPDQLNALVQLRRCQHPNTTSP